MALGFSDGSLQFVDSGTGELVRELSVGGHTDAITCLAFSADGLRLVSGASMPFAGGQQAGVAIASASGWRLVSCIFCRV